jgi:hypothetical protein
MNSATSQASNAPFWMKYIGLPFRLGADPKDGEAADCIRLVLRVLEEAGLNPPHVERKWYALLAHHNLEAIREDWFSLTEQTAKPEEYAMTVLPSASEFSIGVVVSDGLLSVRNETGVLWMPLQNLPPLNYRRLKK